MAIIEAEPYRSISRRAHASLVIIDMQRDFLRALRASAAAVLGNDVSAIAPNDRMKTDEGASSSGGAAPADNIHTREGQTAPILPDLHLPPAKRRGAVLPPVTSTPADGPDPVRGESGTTSSPTLSSAGEPLATAGKRALFHAPTSTRC